MACAVLRECERRQDRRPPLPHPGLIKIDAFRPPLWTFPPTSFSTLLQKSIKHNKNPDMDTRTPLHGFAGIIRARKAPFRMVENNARSNDSA